MITIKECDNQHKQKHDNTNYYTKRSSQNRRRHRKASPVRGTGKQGAREERVDDEGHGERCIGLRCSQVGCGMDCLSKLESQQRSDEVMHGP
mmetsp:Transcript_43792/g.73895  ORF Transcript_43792/g.73895 Transcript_43792/m.73895 type:complete len:92 (+) Transcript_43792:921-1196(+)